MSQVHFVKNTGTKLLQNAAQDAQDAMAHTEKKKKNPPKPAAMGASKVLAALDGLEKESKANKACDKTAPGDCQGHSGPSLINAPNKCLFTVCLSQ